MKLRSIVFLSAIVFGCTAVDTRFASFPDPSLNGRQYSTILVKVNSGDLIFRKTLEDAFAKMGYFGRNRFDSYLRIVPPTRELAPEEIQRRLKDRGMQALLVVDTVTTSIDEHYFPAHTLVTSTTTTEKGEDGSGKRFEREENVQTQTQLLTQYGRQPWITYEVSVYDFQTNERVWMALIDASEHSRSADMREGCRGMALRIWKALFDDSVME